MSEPAVIAEITETIPFYPKLNSIPRNKRAPRTVRLLKEWVVRHLKVEEENILIAQAVNEYIWARGIQKPPRRITVQAKKYDDDVVEVFLAGAEAISAAPIVERPVLEEPVESDLEEEEEEEEE